MNETIKAYARKILSDHGCDEYSYGGISGESILSDLKEAYPNGMEYPYVDVANAIMEISKMRPIIRKPWMMLWDNDDACDGVGCDSFEQALALVEDTFIEWMWQARQEWIDPFCPTKEELEKYNYMIVSYSAYVAKYNSDIDEYEEYFMFFDEDLEQIGWKELTMEDIAAEREAYENA